MERHRGLRAQVSPEAQAVFPRVERGLVDTLRGAAQGRMDSRPVIGDDSVVCVVVAAPGYPAAPEMGVPVTGVAAAQAAPGACVFAAGIGSAPDDIGLVTSGGRVVNVCGKGPTLDAARKAAYAAVAKVTIPNGAYRTDIAAPPPERR